MNEKIKVIIDGKEYEYLKGTSLLEISKDFQEKFKFPIVACYVENCLTELSTKLEKESSLRFIDCMDRIGNRIYQKGLSFVLIYAITLLYGYKEKVKIKHSIDKSILIETSFKLTKENMNKIKIKMQEIIADRIEFEKCLVKRSEAIAYFDKINDKVKADTLKYNTNTFVNVYKLKDVYNYFYTILPSDTGVFTSFDLTYINNHNMVLQFPVVYLNGIVPEYTDNDKMVEIFDEYSKYLDKINIRSSSDVNKLVSKREINGIIRLDEVIANNNLLRIAEDINNRKDEIKLVLLAGPSSSGKTTTSRKLSMFLRSFGLNPKPLSVDDYFIKREDTPLDEEGHYDFESIRAIDISLFNNHLKRILNKEEIKIPTYNFITGEPEYKGNKIKLEDKDILIIEGLHAINEELTKEIASKYKYKIYISELTDLNIDDHNVVSNSDIRLLRRIVRDSRTRGYKAEDTISSWNRVRKGEEKYVFPFQNSVDAIYNTALIYEIGVLKLYVEPLLYEIDRNSPYYEEAKRLLNFLRMFLAIPTEIVPPDSILREFIGNSFFE